jgi:hypothetical protein
MVGWADAHGRFGLDVSEPRGAIPQSLTTTMVRPDLFFCCFWILRDETMLRSCSILCSRRQWLPTSSVLCSGHCYLAPIPLPSTTPTLNVWVRIPNPTPLSVSSIALFGRFSYSLLYLHLACLYFAQSLAGQVIQNIPDFNHLNTTISQYCHRMTVSRVLSFPAEV